MMPKPFYASLLLLPFAVFTCLRSLWHILRSVLRVVLTSITNKSRRYPSESGSSPLHILVTLFSNKIFIRADTKPSKKQIHDHINMVEWYFH